MSGRRLSVAALAIWVFAVAECASAAPVTFTLDPSRSELSWTSFTVLGQEIPVPGGNFLFQLDEQGPGSLVTSYSGSIETDLDLSGGTLEFVGGSNIVAANSGEWLLIDSDPNTFEYISGPANYGIEISGNGTGWSSVFDLVFGLDGGPQALIGVGSSNFSSAISFDVAQGMVGYAFVPAGSLGGPGLFDDLSGQAGGNSAADGTLVDLGGGSYELTLPTNVLLEAELDGNPFGVRLTGELVATAFVPEPGSLTLAMMGLLGAAVMFVRSRRRGNAK